MSTQTKLLCPQALYSPICTDDVSRSCLLGCYSSCQHCMDTSLSQLATSRFSVALAAAGYKQALSQQILISKWLQSNHDGTLKLFNCWSLHTRLFQFSSAQKFSGRHNGGCICMCFWLASRSAMHFMITILTAAPCQVSEASSALPYHNHGSLQARSLNLVSNSAEAFD